MTKQEALKKIEELKEFVETRDTQPGALKKIEELKEFVETRDTQPGALFRHKDGTVYIVGRTGLDQHSLISLHNGNIWDFATLFAGCQSDFSYIGYAEDLIKV